MPRDSGGCGEVGVRRTRYRMAACMRACQTGSCVCMCMRRHERGGGGGCRQRQIAQRLAGAGQGDGGPRARACPSAAECTVKKTAAGLLSSGTAVTKARPGQAHPRNPHTLPGKYFLFSCVSLMTSVSFWPWDTRGSSGGIGSSSGVNSGPGEQHVGSCLRSCHTLSAPLPCLPSPLPSPMADTTKSYGGAVLLCCALAPPCALHLTARSSPPPPPPSPGRTAAQRLTSKSSS